MEKGYLSVLMLSKSHIEDSRADKTDKNHEQYTWPVHEDLTSMSKSTFSNHVM